MKTPQTQGEIQLCDNLTSQLYNHIPLPQHFKALKPAKCMAFLTIPLQHALSCWSTLRAIVYLQPSKMLTFNPHHGSQASFPILVTLENAKEKRSLLMWNLTPCIAIFFFARLLHVPLQPVSKTCALKTFSFFVQLAEKRKWHMYRLTVFSFSVGHVSVHFIT